jgi:hypothetical protein
MRLMRAQMPRRPDYERAHRASLFPWVIDQGGVSNNTFGASPPDNEPLDLILAIAGTATSDVVPAVGTGFTTIDSDTGLGTATVAALMAFKVSAVTNDKVGGPVPGVFTGASRLVALVLRGAITENDGTVLGSAYLAGADGNFTYPALSLTRPSRIVIGHMADDTEAHSVPAGFTVLIRLNSPECVIAISDDLHSTWSATAVAQVGTSLGVCFSCAPRAALGQHR